MNRTRTLDKEKMPLLCVVSTVPALSAICLFCVPRVTTPMPTEVDAVTSLHLVLSEALTSVAQALVLATPDPTPSAYLYS